MKNLQFLLKNRFIYIKLAMDQDVLQREHLVAPNISFQSKNGFIFIFYRNGFIGTFRSKLTEPSSGAKVPPMHVYSIDQVCIKSSHFSR